MAARFLKPPSPCLRCLAAHVRADHTPGYAKTSLANASDLSMFGRPPAKAPYHSFTPYERQASAFRNPWLPSESRAVLGEAYRVYLWMPYIEGQTLAGFAEIRRSIAGCRDPIIAIYAHSYRPAPLGLGPRSEASVSRVKIPPGSNASFAPSGAGDRERHMAGKDCRLHAFAI